MRRLAWLALWLALPASASAYEGKWSLDLGLGWGVAPTLQAPNHGPFATASATFGVGDTWGVRPYFGYGIHPPFNGGPPAQVGFLGVEGIYLIDVFTFVPSFGLGVDALAITNGVSWEADFAVHAVVSLDYLATREIVLGLDVRPYFLLTALTSDPFYLAITLRGSVLFDY